MMATGNDEKIPELLWLELRTANSEQRFTECQYTESERLFPEEPFVPHWQDLVYPNDGVL